MATTAWKVLGQVATAATTDTTLYTAPASTQVVAKCFVANRGAAAALFRIAVRPDGATLANAHYIAYDVTVPANTTLEVPGIAMDGTDVVTVRDSVGTISFSLMGQEIS